MMEFKWDEAKRRQNIEKHGIDFQDAKSVFSRPMVVRIDDREDYGEDRWIGLGQMRDTIIVVAYTEFSEERIRIISARKAVKHEREHYFEKINDELG